MTSKFNQLMYAQIKAKKNEPLSSLGKRVVRMVEKRASVTPTTSILEVTRIASLATLVEEITPCPKKQCMADKGKRWLTLARSAFGTTLALC